MLSLHSVDAVSVFAEDLIKTGRALTAIPQTPLGHLVAASTGPITDTWAATIRDYDDVAGMAYTIGNMLSDTTRSCVETCKESQHDIAMSEKILMMSSGIRAVVGTACNDASPLIAHIYKGVTNQLDALVNNAACGAQVTIDRYAGLWYSSALENALDRYKDSVFKVAQPLRVHSEKTPVELLELMDNHSGNFKEEIQDWIKAVGLDLISTVYHEQFLKVDKVDNVSNLVANCDASSHSRDYALAYFILAFSINNADLQDGINMDLNQYRTALGLILAHTATVCLNHMGTRDREKEQGVLVRHYPAVAEMYRDCGAQIVVNGDLYEKWLEEGGCPDAVLGCFVSDRSIYLKDIQEKCDEYAAKWSGHLRMLTDHAKTVRLKNIRTYIRDVIELYFSEMKEELIVHGTLADYKQRLIQMLEQIYLGQIDDLYTVVRDTVCHVFFPNTDVLWILKNMDDISKDHPNCEPREIASMVTLHYVVRWVCRQMRLK